MEYSKFKSDIQYNNAAYNTIFGVSVAAGIAGGVVTNNPVLGYKIGVLAGGMLAGIFSPPKYTLETTITFDDTVGKPIPLVLGRGITPATIVQSYPTNYYGPLSYCYHQNGATYYTLYSNNSYIFTKSSTAKFVPLQFEFYINTMDTIDACSLIMFGSKTRDFSYKVYEQEYLPNFGTDDPATTAGLPIYVLRKIDDPNNHIYDLWHLNKVSNLNRCWAYMHDSDIRETDKLYLLDASVIVDAPATDLKYDDFVYLVVQRDMMFDNEGFKRINPVAVIEDFYGNTLIINGSVVNTRIDDWHVNPIGVIWKLLTDEENGLGIDVDEIDQDSFLRAFSFMEDNGIGISHVVNNTTSIVNLIDEIARQALCVINYNADGKLTISVIDNTQNYNLHTLTDAEFELINLQTASLETTYTEIRAKIWEYTGESTIDYTMRIAAAARKVFDAGLLWCNKSNKKLAERFMQYTLKQHSNPVKTLTIKVPYSNAYKLYDFVDIQSAQHTTINTRYRITQIVINKDLTLNLVLQQDYSEIESYEEDVEENYYIPKTKLGQIQHYKLLTISDKNDLYSRLYIAAASQDSRVNKCHVYIDLYDIGSVDTADMICTTLFELTADSYDYVYGNFILNIADYSRNLADCADISAFNEPAIMVIDNEIMFIKYTINNTQLIITEIIRGAYNTPKQNHASNSIAFIYLNGLPYINIDNVKYINDNTTATIALVPENGYQEYSNAIEVEYTLKMQYPQPPIIKNTATPYGDRFVSLNDTLRIIGSYPATNTGLPAGAGQTTPTQIITPIYNELDNDVLTLYSVKMYYKINYTDAWTLYKQFTTNNKNNEFKIAENDEISIIIPDTAQYIRIEIDAKYNNYNSIYTAIYELKKE